jgi:hypothetical protein
VDRRVDQPRAVVLALLEVVRQPGGVRQQLLDGDLVAAIHAVQHVQAGHVGDRQPLRDAILQRQTALVDELQHQRHGVELGGAGDEVRRLDRHRRSGRGLAGRPVPRPTGARLVDRERHPAGIPTCGEPFDRTLQPAGVDGRGIGHSAAER